MCTFSLLYKKKRKTDDAGTVVCMNLLKAAIKIASPNLNQTKTTKSVLQRNKKCIIGTYTDIYRTRNHNPLIQCLFRDSLTQFHQSFEETVKPNCRNLKSVTRNLLLKMLSHKLVDRDCSHQ